MSTQDPVAPVRVIDHSKPLAQATTGSIAGTVTDLSGAVVPGANVTVKGEAGQQYTAVTKGDGVFTIPGVPAGTPTYTVTITAPSFKTAVIQNVKVDVATPATVNAQLEPGNINETVVVASGAEVLQTETATVGTTITDRDYRWSTERDWTIKVHSSSKVSTQVIVMGEGQSLCQEEELWIGY